MENLDFTLLENHSLLGYVIVFLGGILTSIGPCNIATVPLVVSYVSGRQDITKSSSFILSLSFAIGMALTFMLLGVIATLVGGMIGASSTWFTYIFAGVCFLIGLNMLGVIQIQFPAWFTVLRGRIGLKGIPGALALGLVTGLASSQCATPVLAAILTYVMAKGAIAYGAALLFVYAMGRGVPVVAAGTFTGVLKNLQKIERWTDVIEKSIGVVVIVIGFYFLWIA